MSITLLRSNADRHRDGLRLSQAPQFGQPIAPADIAPWDISIASGWHRPCRPGRGTATQGEAIYAAKCQACHGEKGAGRPNDQLVGGIGSLAPDKVPMKTVGSYWPYATTLFDYVSPCDAVPGYESLTNDELYAVSAYILNLNGILGREDDARCTIAAQVENAEPGWFRPVPAQSAVSGRGHAICGFAVSQHRAFFCSVSGHGREPTRSGRLQSEQRSEPPHRRLHALAGRQRKSAANRAVAYNNRGLAYQAKGDNDRALIDYNEAIRIDPKFPAAYFNRGAVYQAKGNNDLASHDYSEGNRVEPK